MTAILQQPSLTPQSISTSDGAQIAYYTIGTGPGILVIPGALADAATYERFAQALADQFTVHLLERRGRPPSSPQGANYSMATECADVQAVLMATKTSLVVGHSYGGLIALEAARNNPHITKVAVYEPGVSIDGAISMKWMPAFEQLLEAGRPMDAFVRFSLATGPNRGRTLPPWLMKVMLQRFIPANEKQRMLRLLPECLCEHQEVARLDNHYQHYQEITAAVLLMYGGKTGSHWVDLAMQRLPTVLAHSATHAFPKLDHFGIDKNGPEEVAAVVSTFFTQEMLGRS
ncbi:MAG: alpha/beta hydrolase [Ktedonobacteraceae bacterium]|nr:alpha/beta hydrolase [Ktedonobacteraceae bacterium]MBA3825786.1 alpha/beta hydrolase [Ktedonobacterales bacterium]